MQMLGVRKFQAGGRASSNAEEAELSYKKKLQKLKSEQKQITQGYVRHGRNFGFYSKMESHRKF